MHPSILSQAAQYLLLAMVTVSGTEQPIVLVDGLLVLLAVVSDTSRLG